LAGLTNINTTTTFTPEYSNKKVCPYLFKYENQLGEDIFFFVKKLSYYIILLEGQSR